jgi:hypothetical protein
MKKLINKDDLKYIVTSSYEDDGHDYEVWYEKQCLIVVSINDDSIIDVIFGKVNDFSLSYNVLIELLNYASDTLKNKQNEFKKSNIDKLK